MTSDNSNSKKDLNRGKRLMEERKKIWNSREKFRIDTNLSDGNLKNWENGLNISCDCLREIHNHGGDIVYILTGKRNSDIKSSPKPQLSTDSTDNNVYDKLIEQFEGRVASLERENQLLRDIISQQKK